MRAVLVILLLANVGFLGWNVHHTLKKEAAPAEMSARGTVQRLHLIEEAVPEAGRQGGAGEASGGPEDAPPAQADPGPGVDLPPPPAASAAGPAAGVPQADSAPSVAADSPEVARQGAGAGAVPASATADTSASRCVALGPLPAETDVAAIVAVLEEAGIDAERYTRREERPYRYWIYLPKFPDLASARAALDRLRDADVEDFIRVMQGPNTNAVSLGLYSRKRSALNRVEELRGKGFDPQMDVRYETVAEQWLRMEIAADQALPRARLTRVVGDLPEPGPCP